MESNHSGKLSYVSSSPAVIPSSRSMLSRDRRLPFNYIEFIWMQEMQDQMNSTNDSGYFQDVESNYSGRLSHVSSQPAKIPSSRSMLIRDERLPLNTWKSSGLQENVFGNQFSTSDSLRDQPQRIHPDDVQRERGAVSPAAGTETIFTSDDRQNQGTIPIPTFAGRPLTMSSTIPVELPQNYLVGQQRQQNFNSTTSLIQNRF